MLLYIFQIVNSYTFAEMYNYYIIFTVIIITIIILSNIFIPYNKKLCNTKCWIDEAEFEEAEIFFNNKDIFKRELNNIINSNKWSVWANNSNIISNDNNVDEISNIPAFTLMKEKDIIARLEKNYGKIGETPTKPSWRLYSLILNKKILDTAKYCPETIKLLLNNSTRILNAGFSLLEPGAHIGLHKDYNDTFYRLHIPLIIPKNNNLYNGSIVNKNDIDKPLAILQVENDYRLWKDDEYFIIDDTCKHNAWNNTDENRIVLLVDILRKNVKL